MWKRFTLPELEINWETIINKYTVYFLNGALRNFDTYEDAICFLYSHACNDAIELSLESMIKLTKEYNKIEAR